jgi:hypothetical protein
VDVGGVDLEGAGDVLGDGRSEAAQPAADRGVPPSSRVFMSWILTGRSISVRRGLHGAAAVRA